MTNRLNLGFLLACLLSTCSAVRASSVYISATGNDANDGTSAATAYRTIPKAVAALKEGDTLVVGAGVYHATIAFSKPLKAIQCSGAQQITISNLTFTGGIEGIRLDDCTGVSIVACTFANLSKGLAAQGCAGLRVESCVFSRCAIGASFGHCTDTLVAQDTIVGSAAAGLLVMSSGTGAIANCILAGNGSSYIADVPSSQAWTCDHNVLSGASGPWGAAPTVFNPYEWNAMSNLDRHSVYVAPSFVSPEAGDYHIDPNVTWGGGLPGMDVGVILSPRVALDRDGKRFRVRGNAVCAGAYDYGDPRPSGQWRPTGIKATTGVRQSAGVYRHMPNGAPELVRVLVADAAGVRDLWWDGLDDEGRAVSVGRYEIRSIGHDVRLLDDGAVGDNGDPASLFNPDNADRVVALPNGGFMISSVYDEGGMAIRIYDAALHGVGCSALAEVGYWGLALHGNDIIGALGKGTDAKIVRLGLSGNRMPMPSGATAYPLGLDGADKAVQGLAIAVVGETAYVAITGSNVVSVIDLTTGAKTADWQVPALGGIAADEKGQLYVISGTDACALSPTGQLGNRIATGLGAPLNLAARNGRLAAIDQANNRLCVIDLATGNVVKTLGKPRSYWEPVSLDTWRNPRGAAFLNDGRLAVTEANRIRIVSPDLTSHTDLVSNFLDTAVAHPTRPGIVYCGLGIYTVDEKAHTWQWTVETTPFFEVDSTKEHPAPDDIMLDSPTSSVILDGKPFLVVHSQHDSVRFFEISDPMHPRYAGKVAGVPGIYATIAFNKHGDIVSATGGGLSFRRWVYGGLDAGGNPQYAAKPVMFGPDKDPDDGRAMSQKGGDGIDSANDDIYDLAVTKAYNKMVPAWGADATGLGKSLGDGTPVWFSLSSGGNYMSTSTVNDGKHTWAFGAKSFGGQTDVFDPDGLRVTTGNWSAPTNYSIGFVDVRYGFNPYLRPDGKVGAYVEDDAIGRFGRYRLDGGDTYRKTVSNMDWTQAAATAGAPPLPGQTEGTPLAKIAIVPRVAPLNVNGDWAQWGNITPQITVLPSNVGFKRVVPDDLLQTFRQGAAIGAVAHDDNNLYVYFVVTDDNPHFDQTAPGMMWISDSIELWVEEEQFGLGATADGVPHLFKYRFHNRKGVQWSANYGLPAENIWFQKIADVAAHPLGHLLESIGGVSLTGKPGYAVMAKIPYEEIKLVGGIAGREGAKISDMTGAPGETIRIGLNLDKINAVGRMQDYMVGWPVGVMFSDPTRSFPFRLE